MKKNYLKPKMAIVQGVIHNVICTSLEKGGNAVEKGVKTADTKGNDWNLWGSDDIDD